MFLFLKINEIKIVMIVSLFGDLSPIKQAQYSVFQTVSRGQSKSWHLPALLL